MSTPVTEEFGLAAFRASLAERGFIEGRNISFDFEWALGDYKRLAELAREWSSADVDLIVTSSAVDAVLAAKAATLGTPIVFIIGADPVALGLVQSMSKPGGIITGVTTMTGEIVPKGVLTLRELMPREVRIAVLINPENQPSVSVMTDPTGPVQLAMRSENLQSVVFKASSQAQIASAFVGIQRQKIRLLFVAPDPLMQSSSAQLATLALNSGIAACATSAGFAAQGGVMNYSPDRAEVYRRAAETTARILKGARPGEVPVVQPTKFRFVLNIRTAKALSLEVPPSVLARADEVIE